MSVNGVAVVSPVELATGDKIEIHLEGRTRIFYFHSNREEVGRRPLSALNVVPSPPVSAKKAQRKPKVDDGARMPPPPPQLPPSKPETTAPEEEEEEEKEQPEEVQEPIVSPAASSPLLDKTEVIPEFDDEQMIEKTEKIEFSAEDVEMAVEEEEEPVEVNMDVAGNQTCDITKQAMAAALVSNAIDAAVNAAAEEEDMDVAGNQTCDITKQAMAAALVSNAIDAAVNAAAEEEDMDVAGNQTCDITKQAMAAALVSNAIDAAVNAAASPVQETHPALIQEAVAPLSTAQKTKKSVRFTAMGTPEGTARDATPALPFNLGMAADDDAVLVDDDTLAFAQWAGLGQVVESPAPPTAAAAAEMKQNEATTPAPASAGRRKSASLALGSKLAATPKSAAARTTLADKLSDLVEEHDITFEVPADFMRWTPAPGKAPATGKKLIITVAVNPRGEAELNIEGASTAYKKCKSAMKTPAKEQLATDAVAPRDLAAKLAELEQEHDIAFELPGDFMRWTPAPATLGRKSISLAVTPRLLCGGTATKTAGAGATPGKGFTPAGPGALAPAPTPVTAATKTTTGAAGLLDFDPSSLAAKLAELADEHDVDFDVPVGFMSWTPGPGSKAKKNAMNIAVTPRPVSAAKSQPCMPRSAMKAATTPGKGRTPAPAGARAPASTPNTAVRSVSRVAANVVDTDALAFKLAVLAEQHDVTFELPAGFMRWTPKPATTARKTSGSVIIAGASSCKSQKSMGHSRMAQEVNGTDAFPALTEEVMQPGAAENDVETAFAGDLAASMEAAASSRKASVAKSSSRRRSSARTPLTKIAIIGRSAPHSAAPSSVKKISRTPRSGETEVLVTTDDENSIMAEAEEEIDAVVALAEEEEEEISESAGGVEEEEEEDFDPDYSPANAGPQQLALVPLGDYRRAMLQARIHRSRSIGLATQLRGVSARALRLKKAATGLAAALEEERVKREELQAVLQRIIASRQEESEEEEEEEEEAVVDHDMECDDGDVEEIQAVNTFKQRVVVVGYNPAPQQSHTELAGEVVVVRPTAQRTTTTTTNTTKIVKATAMATPPPPPFGSQSPMKMATAMKKTPGTIKKSVRKIPSGGLIVDDLVNVPEWMIDANQGSGPTADVSAELAEVAAADDAEAQDAEALRKLQQEVEAADAEVAAAEGDAMEEDIEEEGEEDIEEDGPDFCHKCNEGDEGDVLLLCDGCDNACHLSCCHPPLKRVPKGDWFCTDCKAAKAEEAAKAKAAARGKKRTAVVEEKEQVEQPANKTKASKRVREAEEQDVGAPKRARGRQAAAPTESAAAAPKRATRSRR